jgi:two-component system, OmpR family, sensor kinase
VLEESVSVLETAAAKVTPLKLDTTARQAWHAASELFDVSRGHDLRKLLADSIEREANAVVRERAAADQALDWMRKLLVAAACTIALAALMLAARFAKALRRPLKELHTGAKTFQDGHLAYRIPMDGIDEFSAVAQSMNVMAVQLSRHQANETKARHDLEDLVRARTSELQGALDALQSVDGRRRRLFADISHELRTPTTAILGEAEIALRGGQKFSEDYRAALQRIVSTSKQLGSVIDDLLTMARSDIDTLALNRQALDIAGPLREAIQQATALAHERNITLNLAEAPNRSLTVMADPQRLRQLLILMLDNAIHYSYQNGVVEVSVHDGGQGEEAACCEIRITDHGIGISEADLPKVFERSFRGQDARKHRANGSGLGLSIGMAMARAHDGDLSVKSRQGVGTSLTLRLPLLRLVPETA